MEYHQLELLFPDIVQPTGNTSSPHSANTHFRIVAAKKKLN
jgi:hypothetical protein